MTTESCPVCETYIEGDNALECPRCGHEFSADDVQETSESQPGWDHHPSKIDLAVSASPPTGFVQRSISAQDIYLTIPAVIVVAAVYVFACLHSYKLFLGLDSYSQLARFFNYCLGMGYSSFFVTCTLVNIVLTCRMAVKLSTRQAKWLYLWFALVPLFVGIHSSLYPWAYIYDLTRIDEVFPGKNLSQISSYCGLIVGAALSAPAAIWMGSLLWLTRHTEPFDLSFEETLDRGQGPAEVYAEGNIIPIVSLLIPVVGMIIAFNTPQVNLLVWQALIVISTTVLQGIDLNRLQKKNPQVIPGTRLGYLVLGMLFLWIVCYPLSFLRRRRYGKPNLFLLAVFSSLSIFYMPMAGFAIIKHYYGPELPSCEDERVQSLVKKMVEKNFPGKFRFTVSDFQQVEYDKEAEVRRGTFQIRLDRFPDQVQTREFEIGWFEKDKGRYRVEILPLKLGGPTQ